MPNPMCEGKDCTIKKECYRHTAEPCEYRQSYFVEPPFEKKMGGSACMYYWSNRREEDD